VVQIRGEKDVTIDDRVEPDIFKGYKSPDVERARKHKKIFNIGSEAMRASALIVYYQAVYEAIIGYFNIEYLLGGTPEAPTIAHDMTYATPGFQLAGMYFTLGVLLYYGGRWLKNKYEENRDLLNLLTQTREEKRLEHYLRRD
jgi:hypothetical protein